LGRHGEYEVDLASGVVPIEIPIYQVESGNLKLPVKLSYHAGGVKVNDVASTVGSSWSLNAGGVITRSMIGRPDESNNGYLAMSFPPINTENVNNNDFLCFLGRLATFDGLSEDGTPDSFFYNFAGSSGRFTIARRDNSGNEITPTVVTIPYKPIKINYTMGLGTDKIVGFTITDSDGTKYYFGQVNLASGTALESATQGVTNYNSSWYLHKIVSAIADDEINIAYTYPVAIKSKPIYSTSLTKT
jgi:hypothetical protein